MKQLAQATEPHCDEPDIDTPSKVKLWAGDPGQCDICKKDLLADFYDAKTLDGPWACLCKTCWQNNTNQHLGIGLGQHYKRRWEKVGG